ncbi:hypothetical protein C1J01_38370 [Nonomuraea aridisoli]|uniref:Uncharacterized protein n=1 Tax=Nonomuraea aridisoli TaxID=2070368 RepID=A0A2W2DDF0_9ACTN|nr:hypothetical protein C1J01_38370 [Nonomuraea aridisoli]
MDAQGACAILGISYKTWSNKGGASAYGLTPFAPGRRKPLFDRAQVEAVRDGSPIPSRGTGEPHPDDLLDEQDVADELGVAYATVRKDHSTGRLSGWTDVCGQAHIRRATLTEIIAARPGRGVGGGRPRKHPHP